MENSPCGVEPFNGGSLVFAHSRAAELHVALQSLGAQSTAERAKLSMASWILLLTGKLHQKQLAENPDFHSSFVSLLSDLIGKLLLG